MNRSSEKALNFLTGTTNINEITVGDLEQLASDNPYFPVAQFLLAKKLKSENDEQYLIQAQKASLYFANPYWLKYQLTEEEICAEITDPVFVSKEEKAKNVVEENDPIKDSSLHADINSANETSDQKEYFEQPAVLQADAETAVVEASTKKESQDFINDFDTNTSTQTFNEDVLANLPPAVETEVIEFKEALAGATNEIDDDTEKFLDDSEHKFQKEELLKDDEHERMFQNIKAMLDASSEEAGADVKDAVIPMDPYYTIDYFASQGIKLELDQNPQDQLGQHLKKFTQWLKHMKKLGPEDATEAINNTETEADIQRIADSSNTVREVVTEAMAQVLEKQGKNEKAIELYNKLSFLNPDKRTYFADKIKKLKGF